MKHLENKIKKLKDKIQKNKAKTIALKKELKQLEHNLYIKRWARDGEYDGFWIFKKCYHHTLDKTDLDFIKEMVKGGANINYVNKQYGNYTPLDWAIKNPDNEKKYIKELRNLGAKTYEELQNNKK